MIPAYVVIPGDFTMCDIICEIAHHELVFYCILRSSDYLSTNVPSN